MKKNLSLWNLLFLPLSIFSQTPVASMPITLKDNLIFIELTVNGSSPLSFLYDSGAGITVLNSSLAGRLDLEYAGESMIGTSGKKLKAKSTVNNSIQIGALKIEKVPIELLSLDHMSDYFKYPVDGIIGFDLFSKYVVKTDIDEMQMDMYDTTDRPPVSDPGWVKMKMHRVDNNKIAIPVSVWTNDGTYVELLMTIDTANPDEIYLYSKAVDQTDIRLKHCSKPVRGFSVDTTVTTNRRGKLKRVRFAEKEWRNVKTVIPTDPVSVAAFSGNTSYGLIGQELLLDFNIVYDYLNDYCYFQRRK